MSYESQMSYETQYMYEQLMPPVLLVVVAFILFVAIYTYIMTVVIPFSNRKRYLKMEIGRSEGKERRYWKRKLKRHYVRHIPLIGKLIVRYMR